MWMTERQKAYLGALIQNLGWSDRICSDPPTSVEMTAGFIKALRWADRINRSCAGRKKDGSPCTALRKGDSIYCGWHKRSSSSPSARPTLTGDTAEFKIRYEVCPN